jgi:hypothetical protein
MIFHHHHHFYGLQIHRFNDFSISMTGSASISESTVASIAPIVTSSESIGQTMEDAVQAAAVAVSEALGTVIANMSLVGFHSGLAIPFAPWDATTIKRNIFIEQAVLQACTFMFIR